MEALIAVVLIYPLLIILSSLIGWIYRFLFPNPIDRSYLPPVYLPKQKVLDKCSNLKTHSPVNLMYISAIEKAEYLKSGKWKTLRLLVFTRDNYKCVSCNSTKKLECHHLTYTRLTEEKLEDLTTLCRDCHQLNHDYYGYGREITFIPILTKKDILEHLFIN